MKGREKFAEDSDELVYITSPERKHCITVNKSISSKWSIAWEISYKSDYSRVPLTGRRLRGQPR
jgi:hypothetical protein